MWSLERCTQQSDKTLINPAAKQMQEVDVQVGMHLGCWLACTTESAMQLWAFYEHLAWTVCLNVDLQRCLGSQSAKLKLRLETMNVSAASTRDTVHVPLTDNCMAYNAADRPPEVSEYPPLNPVRAAGAGPAVSSTPVPQLETGQPATD